MERHINGLGQIDTATDECLLAPRRNGKHADLTYYVIERSGCPAAFYGYRPAMAFYGDQLHEVCEVVETDEVREAIALRAAYETLAEYADIARLVALGLYHETNT
jgi:hypothetical protein